MNLQTKLWQLFDRALTLKDNKLFDDGKNMPYSYMLLTKNKHHLSAMKLPSGKTEVTLEDANYGGKYGFKLFGDASDYLSTITGHIMVGGETMFITHNESSHEAGMSLTDLYAQNPRAVERVLRKFSEDLSRLRKDAVRIAATKKYWDHAGKRNKHGESLRAKLKVMGGRDIKIKVGVLPNRKRS